MTLAIDPSVSPGYREHVSGLLVPEDVSRARQVWTADEWRLLDRAMTLLGGHMVAVRLACGSSGCSDRTLTRVPTPDGGYVLRCACTDRVFQRAF